jgi:hypothetical protein
MPYRLYRFVHVDERREIASDLQTDRSAAGRRDDPRVAPLRLPRPSWSAATINASSHAPR